VDGLLYVSTYGATSSELWLVPPGGRSARRLGRFPNDFRLQGAHLFQAGGRLLLTASPGEGIDDLWEISSFHHRPRFLARFEGGMGPVTEVGGRLVFAAAASYVPDGGLSLWVLAPGMTHPLPVGDCPGGCPTVELSAAGFVAFGGRLFFAARDAQRGSELWQTDGTGPGTGLFHDLCPGPCDGSPAAFSPALGRLLFEDGDQRLWVTDGTQAGTLPLARLSFAAPFSSAGLDLAEVNGRVVFPGLDEAGGSRPWVSDLTPEGTEPLLVP
jgi:ELWxxDGT repeat protein